MISETLKEALYCLDERLTVLESVVASSQDAAESQQDLFLAAANGRLSPSDGPSDSPSGGGETAGNVHHLDVSRAIRKVDSAIEKVETLLKTGESGG